MVSENGTWYFDCISLLVLFSIIELLGSKLLFFCLQTILCVPIPGYGVVELGSTDLVGVKSFVLHYYSFCQYVSLRVSVFQIPGMSYYCGLSTLNSLLECADC